MTNTITKLEPVSVWKYFNEISQIPRCSGNEEAVGNYIIELAKKSGLNWKKDHTGNIVIKKPATKGMEERPACVIQGHLDIVCEKNKGTVHDFEKDPIKLIVDGDWLKADGTTLGADNGIAIAMALAVMESDEIVHPAMEFLFTVDEETGLTGANELQDDFVDGKILLNIDSEEEGALYIGCAGGQHTILEKDIEWQDDDLAASCLLIKVEGLRGGHSGLNIVEEFGNALKLLGRFLYVLQDHLSFQLASVDGGNKHNAIPREAEAVICISTVDLEKANQLVHEYNAVYKEELKFVDQGVQLSMETHDPVKQVFSAEFASKLIRLIHTVPHGVMAMSHAVEGLVETSTNLAILETHDKLLHILTSQRSSIPSGITDIASKIKACGELSGYDVEEGGGYPPWVPNPESGLLKICQKIYKNKYGKDAEVKAIHAGLECGIIGEHYPGMDMISFGPDLEGAHSPDERVRISSAQHIWEFLLEILRDIR